MGSIKSGKSVADGLPRSLTPISDMPSSNNSILDTVDLDTPPFERQSQGMWIDVPRSGLDLLKRKGLNPAEAIHAAEHAVLNLAPLFAMSSPGDVRTECKVAEKEYASKPTTRKRPARWVIFTERGEAHLMTDYL